MIVPRFVLGGKGYTAPSDRLTVASVGVGGKGWSDINYFDKSGKANVAFLCDVDDRSMAPAGSSFLFRRGSGSSASSSFSRKDSPLRH